MKYIFSTLFVLTVLTFTALADNQNKLVKSGKECKKENKATFSKGGHIRFKLKEPIPPNDLLVDPFWRKETASDPCKINKSLPVCGEHYI
jgi:hypothetical protein